MEIEILNGSKTAYTVEHISKCLQGEKKALSHGGEFTGRPTTQIIASEHHIIKLRNDYQSMSMRESRRFAEQQIEKEAQLNIYHPVKTWFIYRNDPHSKIMIANIMPKLQPLHVRCQQLDEDTVTLIAAAINMYLEVGKRCDLQLDLSLSNYAIDENEQLFYLDDDTYTWDNFTTLSNFLGHLLRSQEQLSETHAQQLARLIHDQVLQHFNDKHWLFVVAEELKNTFVTDEKRNTLSTFCNDLINKKETVIKSLRQTSGQRLGIIADIHSNAPALQTALAFLKQERIDQFIVLGDIVGYGPHPEECITLLQACPEAMVIKGNHDHAAVDGNCAQGFSTLARWVIEWTHATLTSDSRNWLHELPPFLEEDDWIAVHGSPCDRTFFKAYVYEMTYERNLDHMHSRNKRLCFHGHTHIQKVYFRRRNQAAESISSEQLALDGIEHALVCPGSIGQPRGGKTGVELSIFDPNQQQLMNYRLPYDNSRTIRDMERQHFPAKLIERLEQGY